MLEIGHGLDLVVDVAIDAQKLLPATLVDRGGLRGEGRHLAILRDSAQNCTQPMGGSVSLVIMAVGASCGSAWDWAEAGAAGTERNKKTEESRNAHLWIVPQTG